MTSGYAQDIIVAQGANGTFPVFAKPYSQQDLAREVRRLMTSKAG